MHALLSSACGEIPEHRDRANPKADERDLVVSHEITPRLELDGRKCIVMIRDPFECLHSYFKLMHPTELTAKKFEWALYSPVVNGENNKSGWIAYWKHFVDYHVLKSDALYPNERMLVPYERLIQYPGAVLRNVINFVGSEGDQFKALAEVNVSKRNHGRLHLWTPELMDRVRFDLEPRCVEMVDRGIL